MGALLGQFIALIVATSDEECVSKLSQHGLMADRLPKSFGGTWNDPRLWRLPRKNSCFSEPSEQGRYNVNDDGEGEESKCAHEIHMDADLNCIVRNVLWSHTQQAMGLTSASDQHLQTKDPVSLDGCVATPFQTFTTGVFTEDDGYQMHRHYNSSRSQNTRESRRRQPQEPPQSSQSKRKSRRTVHNSDDDEVSDPHQQERSRKARALIVPPSLDAIVDKKERRRKMEAFYAKRKREKKKVEIGVLEEQYGRLSADNKELKDEQCRLENLLRAAKEQVEQQNLKIGFNGERESAQLTSLLALHSHRPKTSPAAALCSDDDRSALLRLSTTHHPSQSQQQGTIPQVGTNADGASLQHRVDAETQLRLILSLSVANPNNDSYLNLN